jgi:hypothetical protein
MAFGETFSAPSALFAIALILFGVGALPAVPASCL